MKFTQDDGRLALAFRAIPVVFALILAINVGALFVLGSIGGSASGDRLDVSFQAPCAEAAAAIIQARVDAMGLGDPELSVQGDTIHLVATMPGHDDDATAVPAVLARRGQLQVHHGTELLATDADLADVQLALDEGGMPYDELSFRPEAGSRLAQATQDDPGGTVIFSLDGEILAERPNTIRITDEKLRLPAGEGLTRLRMRRAADRAIVLGHGPLPCDVTVASVVEAD